MRKIKRRKVLSQKNYSLQSTQNQKFSWVQWERAGSLHWSRAFTDWPVFECRNSTDGCRYYCFSIRARTVGESFLLKNLLAAHYPSVLWLDDSAKRSTYSDQESHPPNTELVSFRFWILWQLIFMRFSHFAGEFFYFAGRERSGFSRLWLSQIKRLKSSVFSCHGTTEKTTTKLRSFPQNVDHLKKLQAGN